MTSVADNSMPIDVDSKREQEVRSMPRRLQWFKSGAFKPVADGKPPKHQRKHTSTFWEHYEFLEPDEDGTVVCKCKKYGQVHPGDSKFWIRNLKRQTLRSLDIGQLLLDSRSTSLGNRRPDFDPEVFCKMMVACIIKHNLPLQFCEYDILIPVQLNLDDLCGDVMKMNLHNDEDNSVASKSKAGSGVG
ncbi:hypothetical protein Cgig2_006908 [Carnegiea gigantea]|uniref:Uncharacterized protein n=1 Tax=Carnegiea gigantea TaxID=171969 RepID=A0A9Q1K4E3_9CARY|nr:hypothetical protein Cgig2_006908 [Carnegiea gigantea]